jgi:hypothetical protein
MNVNTTAQQTNGASESTSTPSPKFLGYLGRYMPDCYYPKNLWNGALARSV